MSAVCALINLNDEAGCDQFSVELSDNVGDWLDSFPTLPEALAFIATEGLRFDYTTGLRDTRAVRDQATFSADDSSVHP